ncbi:type II secretion system F family protein [Candidatus Dojkabacteria bacterium]|nr:type II secretion system F family protein [Candidatus Dojkabacteria bacterium]
MPRKNQESKTSNLQSKSKNKADLNKTKSKTASKGLYSYHLSDILYIFSKGKERDFFVEQLSILLLSGMDLLASLMSIRDEMKSTYMKNALSIVVEGVENGASLWQSLERANILNPHFISLVKIGEKSGKLIDNLKVISLQYQKDKMFQSKVLSAVIYPAIVLGLTFVVATVSVVFILPRISLTFGRMNLDLNILTKTLMAVGDFVSAHGIIAIPSFLILTVLMIYFIFFFSKTKFIGQWILMILPGIKRMILEVELSRFGYVVGTLLDSGVPIVDVLSFLSSVSSYEAYKKFYRYLKERVENGNSFKKAFSSYKHVDRLLPLSFQNLIITAEQGGNLSLSLKKVGEIYEEKLDVTTKNMSVILEPILLIIVWLGVVLVALAVIMPIYTMIGNVDTLSGSNTNSSTVETRNEEETPILQDAPDSEQTTNDGSTQADSESTEQLTDTKRLTILETSTGYLNVRSSPMGEVIGEVYPGEIYEYTEEQSGWYKIVVSDELSGWVSSEYVSLL